MFDLFDDVSEKMVNRCVVVNCSSNKRKPGGRRRVSLFKVPKDPKLITQWKLNLPAIRKVLDSNCYVCEKHFNKSDVLKTYEENLPSGKWEIARSRATLKSGAIPMAVKGKRTSKKKNTSVLNNSADQATSNNVDGKGNIHEEHNYPMQYADNSAVQSIFNGMSNVIVEYDNVMDTEENKAEANCNFEKPFTFKTLWKNLATLKLPNAAWDYFMSPQRNLISFFAIQADCVLRRVNIYSDLSMQVTIDLVLVPEKRLCNLTSLNDVVWFLLRVSQWNLCETLKNSKRCVPLGPCEGIAPRDIHLGAPRRRCLSCAIMAKKKSKVKQQVKPQTVLVQESTCDQS